jgi:hypothetical protein
MSACSSGRGSAPSELSEGEFACYEARGDVADSGPRLTPETLNQAALEEQRARDALLLSYVKEGVSLAHARELLITARWDIHKLLAAEEEPPALRRLRALALGEGLGADDGAQEKLCPACQEPLDPQDEPDHAADVRYFTGCPNQARHGAHAECLAAYARICVADGAAGLAPRPGTVPCCRCLADGAATPGYLTEAQVEALVEPESMVLYRKARLAAPFCALGAQTVRTRTAPSTHTPTPAPPPSACALCAARAV